MSKQGTLGTYHLLLRSTQQLSDKQLAALEEDLDYYSQTGLIGVNMSRLLALLKADRPSEAA